MNLDYSNAVMTTDPHLIDYIVTEVKSQGIFDQFRKECIADVDTKPAYQNLRTRVESSVNSFLDKRTWRPDLNKNQLRETLRKHIHDAPYLDVGVERIVDQVVNPKIYSIFMPQIEDVVYKFLGLQKPQSAKPNEYCNLKDLLPQDLDPVSPESDKNSNSAELPNGNIETICEESVVADTNLEEINVEELKNNLNNSLRSDADKTEEEEESPLFEPIDVAFNESNVSNDSHLSGISELTGHRTPGYTNDYSQDSRASSNSRLSIVTDPSPSNSAATPGVMGKEEKPDHFKAIREFTNKEVSKFNFEEDKSKESKHNSKDKEQDSKKKSSHSESSSRSKTSDKHSKDSGKSQDKEIKDLKDLYKEKIRELREKKELTEKEKMEKKSSHDLKDKKESSSRSRSHKSSHSSKSSNSRSSDKKRSDDYRSKNGKRSSHDKSSSRDKKDSRSDSKHSRDKKTRDDKNRHSSKTKSSHRSHGSSTKDSLHFSDSDTKHGFEPENRNLKRMDQSVTEICLPLKKRPLPMDGMESEQKKQKTDSYKYSEKEVKDKIKEKMKIRASNIDDDDVSSVPDEERVQIIEIPDEEYEEQEFYPETEKIIWEGEEMLHKKEQQPVLSEMEQAIQRSLIHSMIIEQDQTQQQQQQEDKESLIRDLENPSSKEQEEILSENIDGKGNLTVEDNPGEDNSLLTQEIINEIKERRASNEIKEPTNKLSQDDTSIEDMVAAMDSMEEDICPSPDVQRDDQSEEFKEINQSEFMAEYEESYASRSEEIEICPELEIDKKKNYDQEKKEGKSKDSEDESIGETVKLGSDSDNESVESSVKSENNLVIDEKQEEEVKSCSVIKNLAFRDSDEMDQPQIIVVDPNCEDSEMDSCTSNSSSSKQLLSPTEEDCHFLSPNNDYYQNFKQYFELVEKEVEEDESLPSTSMLPPLKRYKRSVSPAPSSNESTNNDRAPIREELEEIPEDVIVSSMIKKRKMSKAKKLSTGSTSSHSSVNGDSLDMPGSPQSDISASSDKAGSRDEKNRSRNTQRYSSDDLYKPRPLFASSSRRNRRSNQS